MSYKFAMVFPGQGSQSIGMLHDLAAEHAIVHETFEQASSVLNIDLWEIVRHGPLERINQTEITQPVLLAASVAIWRIWHRNGGPNPTVMVGHSLGEYSALVCAGVLDFSDAVRLVYERGRCMQNAVPENVGAMAAIVGLSNEIVERWCEEISQQKLVSPANYNAPGQLVVAGYAEAVDELIERAKQAGAKIAKRLLVSVPSHCALMKNASESFGQLLNNIEYKAPFIPVIHNVDLGTHMFAQEIKNALLKQLEFPVRWTESIELLANRFHVKSVFECGPGKVLCGLIKRIDSNIECYSLSHSEGLNNALELMNSLFHFDKDVDLI